MKALLFACILLLAPQAHLLAQPDMQQVKNTALQWRVNNGLQILNDFRALLSLPNVSTSKADMAANAEWIEAYLARRKFRFKRLEAGGAPYIFAEREFPGATRTILIYAHFDGQPVSLDRWQGSPWKPVLRTDLVENGGDDVAWPESSDAIDETWRIFARSAGDDKAPVIALMAAIDALTDAGLRPGVNVKLLLDGEEEFGSPTLAAILEQHGDLLKTDLMLFCDGPMHQSGRRHLVFGVRGSVEVHLTTYGPTRPLHSGHYGNWSPNAGEQLVRLVNTFHDAEGRIRIADYYQDVRPISKAEQTAIDAMPRMDATLLRELAIHKPRLPDTRLEEAIMQPAAVITGIRMGTVGEDARNVILPSATATINLRLVPDQTPERVQQLVNAHLEAQGYKVLEQPATPADRRAHANLVFADWSGAGYPAFRTDLSGREAQQLERIVAELDGTAPLMTPTMGGSLPIYLFERALGVPIILLPVANHDNNQHGPNENLRIRNLWQAIDVYAAVLALYGREE